MQDPELRERIRAEVRSYVATVAARYVPVLAGALAVVLLIVVVPDATSQSTTGLGAPGASGAPATGVPGASAPAGTGTPTPRTGGSGGQLPLGPSLPGSSQSTPVSNVGVAVSGVQCGPGVRQFSWSPYSPLCVARWTGNNGGATAHGVTKSTITLVMRNPSDWDSTSKGSGAPTFAGLAYDTQVLVKYFNSQYELYGRQVVVKTFNGNGSFLAESANQGQDVANSDAQTAYGLGAFADGFPIVTGTYADAESSHHIIQFAPANSDVAYKANAPYRYGFPAGAVNEVQGAGIGSLVCQRMAGMKAVFAGDPSYQTVTRKFAVLEPDQPEFAGGAAVIIQDAKRCGVSVESFRYSTQISTEAQQAVQISAQLKNAHVTTVLMLTDPFMSQFMTNSAAQQQYRPEWVFTVFPPFQARQADKSEMAHSIQISPWHATTGAPSQRLCAHIYKLAGATGAPMSGPAGLDQVCTLLMAFYAGLQQAGPTLTPSSFYQGWFSLPNSSTTSDFGRWSFGSGQWSPVATFSVLQWNGTAHSNYDGGTGQFEPCGGPVDYPYENSKLGSGQLKCYGR
jgi:hypothetical protein